MRRAAGLLLALALAGCAGGAAPRRAVPAGPADDGIPGDNAAEGGIPAPAVVPNVDGSLSPPGMPGDV